MRFCKDFPIRQEPGGVVQGLTLWRIVGRGRANNGCDTLATARYPGHRFVASPVEIIKFEKVPGRVAAHGKFGKYNQIGLKRFRLCNCSGNPGNIVFEITHTVVQLGQCDFHHGKLKNEPDIEFNIIQQAFFNEVRFIIHPGKDVVEGIGIGKAQ